MVSIRVLSEAMADQPRGASIFRGDLLVFTRVPELDRFRDYVEALIREAFDGMEPESAQFHCPVEDYLARVKDLQRRVRGDSSARELFLKALENTGAVLDDTYWDWIYLRVLPVGDTVVSPRTAKVGFHRDTWSSNIGAQTNWWTPVYPIVSERALAFYPQYWSKPIANTSSQWDLDELRAEKRRRKSEHVSAIVPEVSEPVDTSAELRMVIEPGDLLCFSGAHLHASVPNTSEATRFSVEVRTVNRNDLSAGRGAPDIDGAAPRTPLHWFTHTETARPLQAG